MRSRKLNVVIQGAINRDPVALEQLCKLYTRPILLQTKLLVRNKDEAEDAAQRVVIEMIRGIGNLRSPYAFRAWLQRIITNVCYKQNAQSRLTVEHGGLLEQAEVIPDESLEAHPEDCAVANDMRNYLDGYLGQLPHAQAVAITMFYYEELSYREIAKVLNIEVGTVASTISKAKKNLKALLTDKREAASLGIVFGASLFQDSIKDLVVSEAGNNVSEATASRLVDIGKLVIAGSPAGVHVAVVAMTATKIACSVITALAVLTGTGFLASQLPLTKEEVPAVVEIPKEPLARTPEGRVVYKIYTNGDSLEPVNPIDIQLVLDTGEMIGDWVLTKTDSGASTLTGSGDFLAVNSLNLEAGDYTLVWYVMNAEHLKTKISFAFYIR